MHGTWSSGVEESKTEKACKRRQQERYRAGGCMYLSVFIPISTPSQPCSALGRARLGGPTGEPGWAQAVQQLCPAPRHCWGCAGPALVEVPWCSRHSPSVPPGTVGPSRPKTAGRSIVPRWPLQVPAVSELLARQVGHVPQTLVGRGDAGLTLGWWLLQEMPRVVFSTATLPVAASWASVVSVSPQESPFPQAGPMPQEPCPAVALGAPVPRTSPQSLGHPGGSRGGA